MTLPKMIRESSLVIGGPLFEVKDMSEAVESVREEDAEEPGGVAGRAEKDAGWPDHPLRFPAKREGRDARTCCEWEVDIPYECEVVGVCLLGLEELRECVLSLGHDGSNRGAHGFGSKQCRVVLVLLFVPTLGGQ